MMVCIMVMLAVLSIVLIHVTASGDEAHRNTRFRRQLTHSGYVSLQRRTSSNTKRSEAGLSRQRSATPPRSRSPSMAPVNERAGPSQQRSTMSPPRSRPLASGNTARAGLANLPGAAVSSTVSHILDAKNTGIRAIELEPSPHEVQDTFASFKHTIAVASVEAARQQQKQQLRPARRRDPKKTKAEKDVEEWTQTSKAQYAKARQRSKTTKTNAQRGIAAFGRGSDVATNLLETHADAKAEAIRTAENHSYISIIAGNKLGRIGKWQDSSKHHKTAIRMMAKAREYDPDEQALRWRSHRDTLRRGAAGLDPSGDAAFQLSTKGSAVNAGYRLHVQRYRKARQFNKDIREEFSGSDSSDSETTYSDVERD